MPGNRRASSTPAQAMPANRFRASLSAFAVIEKSLNDLIFPKHTLMNSKRPFNSGLFIIIHLVNSQPLVAETLRLAKLNQIFILANNDEEALEKVTAE